MPICSVAPSGMRSATSAAMARSTSVTGGGAGADSGDSTSAQPSASESWKVCSPLVLGMFGLTSTTTGTSPSRAAA